MWISWLVLVNTLADKFLIRQKFVATYPKIYIISTQRKANRLREWEGESCTIQNYRIQYTCIEYDDPNIEFFTSTRQCLAWDVIKYEDIFIWIYTFCSNNNHCWKINNNNFHYLLTIWGNLKSRTWILENSREQLLIFYLKCDVRKSVAERILLVFRFARSLNQ